MTLPWMSSAFLLLAFLLLPLASVPAQVEVPKITLGYSNENSMLFLQPFTREQMAAAVREAEEYGAGGRESRRGGGGGAGRPPIMREEEMEMAVIEEDEYPYLKQEERLKMEQRYVKKNM